MAVARRSDQAAGRRHPRCLRSAATGGVYFPLVKRAVKWTSSRTTPRQAAIQEGGFLPSVTHHRFGSLPSNINPPMALVQQPFRARKHDRPHQLAAAPSRFASTINQAGQWRYSFQVRHQPRRRFATSFRGFVGGTAALDNHRLHGPSAAPSRIPVTASRAPIPGSASFDPNGQSAFDNSPSVDGSGYAQPTIAQLPSRSPSQRIRNGRPWPGTYAVSFGPNISDSPAQA